MTRDRDVRTSRGAVMKSVLGALAALLVAGGLFVLLDALSEPPSEPVEPIREPEPTASAEVEPCHEMINATAACTQAIVSGRVGREPHVCDGAPSLMTDPM